MVIHNTAEAKAAGYTKPIVARGECEDWELLVKPDTDYDSVFKGWSEDEACFVRVFGFNCEIEED